MNLHLAIHLHGILIDRNRYPAVIGCIRDGLNLSKQRMILIKNNICYIRKR